MGLRILFWIAANRDTRKNECRLSANDNDEPTIYVATMNHRFFVSHDAGKTFTEINDGIKRVSYKQGEQHQYILAEGGRVFGCTEKADITVKSGLEKYPS